VFLRSENQSKVRIESLGQDPAVKGVDKRKNVIRFEFIKRYLSKYCANQQNVYSFIKTTNYETIKDFAQHCTKYNIAIQRFIPAVKLSYGMLQLPKKPRK
jgi:hypothetical protein